MDWYCQKACRSKFAFGAVYLGAAASAGAARVGEILLRRRLMQRFEISGGDLAAEVDRLAVESPSPSGELLERWKLG